MNKYIVEKSERKYKKLEINVFKNITLISVSKQTIITNIKAFTEQGIQTTASKTINMYITKSECIFFIFEYIEIN